jgi:glycosyltransferase involved in cell wall biosynthesis
MKILHVISGLTKGGGQRVVVELANEAFQKGGEVTIVAGWPEDPAVMQNLINAQINVQFIGQTKQLAYLKIIPWVFKNRKWICSFDVLHSHLTMGSIIASVFTIISKLSFQKIRPISVETYHAVGMPIPKFNRWFHSQLMLFRDGVVFMAKDPYWDNFIKNHPRLKTPVIPNGVSVVLPSKKEAQKEILLSELGIPQKYSFIVGTVGMLRPERKPELYIPIFQLINKILGKDIHFLMVGGGGEFDRIKMIVNDSGLKENIHLPGTINNPTYAISNMDIYVSVSVGETAGISMIEAAMCKVPVVAIQLTEGYKAKTEDWVWSHTDTTEVANRIIFLLQNKYERNKLAANQFDYVNKHFTSEAMYAAYNLFYNELNVTE